MSVCLGRGESVHCLVGIPRIKALAGLVWLGPEQLCTLTEQVVWVGRASSGRVLTQTTQSGLYL